MNLPERDLSRNRINAKQVASVIKCILNKDTKFQLTEKLLPSSRTGVIHANFSGYYLHLCLLNGNLVEVHYCLTPAQNEYDFLSDKGKVSDYIDTVQWTTLTHELLGSSCPEGMCPKCWSAGRELWEGNCMCTGAVGPFLQPGEPRVKHQPIAKPVLEEEIPSLGLIKVFRVTMNGEPISALHHDKGTNKQGARFPMTFVTTNNIYATQELATKASNEFMDYWLFTYNKDELEKLKSSKKSK